MEVEKIVTKVLFLGDFKTKKNLAKFLGIDPSAINQWKNNKNIPSEHLNKIENIIKSKESLDIKPLHVNNSIPLYPNLKASCSCGSVACNHVDGEVERIEFPKEYMLKTLGINSTNGVHAIIADGESMEPTIKHGDIIFVEPCESIKDGKVYIINIDDETYCKRVYKDLESGGLILRSDNAVAPEIKLSKSRAMDMRIVGRVSVALSVVDL